MADDNNALLAPIEQPCSEARASTLDVFKALLPLGIRLGLCAIPDRGAPSSSLIPPLLLLQRGALAVLTVSDHIITHESMPSEQREKSLNAMVEIALNAALNG